MRTRQRLLLGIALCLVWAGCDERELSPVTIAGGRSPGRLDGLWTGHAEITPAEGVVRLSSAGAIRNGFAFPVALELRADRSFTLRSSGYPIVGAPLQDKRFCRGVFATEGNTIAFFPDDVCPALPLSRFTIGRSSPRGLALEAATRPALPGQVFGEGVSLRVRFELERD